MANRFKWAPGAAGGGLTGMMQVGPSEAKINFCKWMPVPTDTCLGIPELDKLVWIVVVGLIFWSVGWWLRDSERFKPMFWPSALIVICGTGLIIGILMAVEAWPYKTPPQTDQNAGAQTLKAPPLGPDRPTPVSEPRTSTSADLIGSARIVYNAEEEKLLVANYENIQSVTVEQFSTSVVGGPYLIKFVFLPHQGPFDVLMSSSLGDQLIGGLGYSVTENRDRYVEIKAGPPLTVPRSHELKVSFYRKRQVVDNTINAPNNQGIITNNQSGGHNTIINEGPRRARFNDKLKSDILQHIPKNLPVSLHIVGGSADQAVGQEVYDYLVANGYTVKVSRTNMLLPAPESPFGIMPNPTGTYFVVAPSAR